LQIYFVDIRNFRGFKTAKFRPAEHVVAMGEPGAGRSDLVEALIRVFSPEATRLPLTDDLDFYGRDPARPIEVEITVGALGDELEQVFFDKIEYWDPEAGERIEQLEEPEMLDRDVLEPVVRLCYRAVWSEEDEQASQWVDYPKTSDPESEIWDRARRADREALPFYWGHAGGRPLSLGTRALLRRIVAESPGGDFAEALERLTAGLDELASGLASAEQMRSALEAALDSARLPLDLGDRKIGDLIRFVPEGGALGSVLRSLVPPLDLPRGGGFLPLYRHGSTASALLAASELVAMAGAGAVVAVDDFGEHLDPGSARHLAATLRSRAAQLWLTTRHAPVAEAFRPSELVRLAFDHERARAIHQGWEPQDKAERMAARHFALQLLPAMTARTLAIVEGPHDRSSLASLAERLLRDDGEALPAARRIAIVDAGAAEGAGGSSAVPRLATAARRLGFFTIVVIDGDTGEQAEAELQTALAAADAVIRLPDGKAIELAILEGLTDDEIREAIGELEADQPPRLHEHAGDDLITLSRKLLKQRGGLHAQYLDALPPGRQPALARRVLEQIRTAAEARTTGLIQL